MRSFLSTNVRHINLHKLRNGTRNYTLKKSTVLNSFSTNRTGDWNDKENQKLKLFSLVFVPSSFNIFFVEELILISKLCYYLLHRLISVISIAVFFFPVSLKLISRIKLNLTLTDGQPDTLQYIAIFRQGILSLFLLFQQHEFNSSLPVWPAVSQCVVSTNSFSSLRADG